MSGLWVCLLPQPFYLFLKSEPVGSAAIGFAKFQFFRKPVHYHTTRCMAAGIFKTRASKKPRKNEMFRAYSLCSLFDTLENRVVTSRLTLASFWKHFWVIPTRQQEQTLAKDGGFFIPRIVDLNIPVAFKENDG